MRTTTFVFAFVLSISGLSAGQELVEFQSLRDGFKITLAGQPTVTDTTWMSQQGYTLPGRVYRVDKGRERYSITVIDYSGIEQMAIEHVRRVRRALRCARAPTSAVPASGNTTCGRRSCLRRSSSSSATRR